MIASVTSRFGLKNSLLPGSALVFIMAGGYQPEFPHNCILDYGLPCVLGQAPLLSGKMNLVEN